MAGLEILFTPLQGLLNCFQQERHFANSSNRHTQEQRQRCLSTIYKALIATKKYQELTSGAPDREKELELSELWAQAAIQSGDYFKECAPVFYTKARYWSKRIKWPQEVVIERGIALEQIEDLLSDLMK